MRTWMRITPMALVVLAFAAVLVVRGADATRPKAGMPAQGRPAARVSSSTTAAVSVVGAAAGLPASWVRISTGPNGGAVWSGLIPNRYAAHEGKSAVYLPPRFSSVHRYPVLYLLHGLKGSPSSYVRGLHLARVADRMITSAQITPMIIVIPAGAHSSTAEWAGPWESFVVRDVVPWVDGRLPTIASPAGRALGGLCAGGYGAMDIGLRHPGLFGALESWQGYFAPVFRDGPFSHASQRYLNANDPTLLVQHRAAALRRDGIRFYVSVGGNHELVLRRWSVAFSSLLNRLQIPNRLWQAPAAQRKHFWRATMPSALQFASNAFTRPTVVTRNVGKL